VVLTNSFQNVNFIQCFRRTSYKVTFLDAGINHREKKLEHVFLRGQEEILHIVCVWKMQDKVLKILIMVVNLFCFRLFVMFNSFCFEFVQENHQNTFSIVEQALVLSGLTDYITCASQNELFHTFHKKADRRGLSTIFMCLSRKWERFFHKLGPYGKFGSLYPK
jgi:hypothetical protein